MPIPSRLKTTTGPSWSHSLALFILLFLPSLVSASVLAIDYGTDFTKVSLMKPGVPFDVVLNKDSKRKIASSVAWKGEERLFGGDAVNIATRFPSTSFSSLKMLQGAGYSSAPSQFHALLYPALRVSEVPERNTHSFVRKEDEEWTNEELVAMQFGYVKSLAEGVAKERVRDAVVTVPAYYTQYERQAVIDSLELAGLKGLSLVNDGTAIAVNYAMSRTFQELEHHIIYDAGASSIRATLVSFQTLTEPVHPKSKKTKDVLHIEVKGFGYDRVASGSEMDYRLRELLREKFEEKHSRAGSIKDETRAIAKLWKEANRVKTILSANTESRVSIESFFDDIDFKTSVSRTEFEEACSDLYPRYTQPVLDALEGSGIGLNDVSSIILAGGISRIPMVQGAVKFTFGDAKVAHNINADEASVLGAAFYGASLSRQFKTKEIKVQDRFLGGLDVTVSYTAESKSGGQRNINTVVFPSGAKYGTRKTMTFKRKEDFTMTVGYKNAEDAEIPPRIFSAELVGVTEAMANLTEKAAIDPVIKVTVGLSESGLVTIHEALAYGEIKDESIADDVETETITESATTEASSTPESTPTAARVIPTSIPLEVTIKHISIVPYTSTEIAASRLKLQAVDNAEMLRHKKEEARNMLEGYLYRMRDLLDGGETSPFMLFSKPEERKKLEDKMWDGFRWINEEAETADIKELWSRRDEMEAIEKPIQFRYEENEAAPKELENLQKALQAGQAFLESAYQNRTMEIADQLPHKYTLEELEDVKSRLKETGDWLQQGVEQQKKLMKNDDPVLISAEMKARGVTLQKHVMTLLKRKTPKPPPKKEVKKEEKSDDKASSEKPVEDAPKGDEQQKVVHPDL